MSMKKVLTTLVCGLYLGLSATQASAALLTDWTFDLVDASFTSPSGAVTPDVSWDSYYYSNTMNALTPSPSTGPLYLDPTVVGASDSIPLSDMIGLTVDVLAPNASTENVVTFPLTDLSFSYVVSDSTGAVSFTNTYTIPLYAYYGPNGNTFVYYDASEVGTSGATAATYDGYKYGVTGVGLFFDGRALTSFSDGNGGTFFGWLINEDTRNYDYEDYVVGENNEIIGTKADPGKFLIQGQFSLTSSLIPVAPNPTPEPATMLLTGLGLAGLGAMKRRRSQK